MYEYQQQGEAMEDMGGGCVGLWGLGLHLHMENKKGFEVTHFFYRFGKYIFPLYVTGRDMLYIPGIQINITSYVKYRMYVFI